MLASEKIIILGLKGTGKSTIYQKLTKIYALNKDYAKKISPVVNYQEAPVQLKNRIYNLIDTPAFLLCPQNLIEKEIQQQTNELLKNSDLILWILDLSQGIKEEVSQLNKYLRKFSTPQLVIGNKLDLVKEPDHELSLYQSLGRSTLFALSALKKEEIGKLVEKIATYFPSQANLPPLSENSANSVAKEKLNLVIFGSPNSGKSTLMNYLLKKKRSLVSPIAGTTQEPVFNNWKWQDLDFQLIDTAGITPESKKKEQIILRKADLAWVIIDATVPLSKQILQIIHLGEKYQKTFLIIVNKVDLISKEKQKEIENQIRLRIKSLRFVPIIFLSAQEGTGIIALFSFLEQIFQQSQKQFSKRILQQCLEGMVNRNPPPYYGKRKLKIYFIHQEKGLVRYFILFVNNKRYIHFSYQRYITNYLREKLDLKYLPIKLVFKNSA